MSDTSHSSFETQRVIPSWLTNEDEAPPVYFLDTGSINLQAPGSAQRVNEVLFELLCQAHSSEIQGQALIKVHIGEPCCATRLRPEFTDSSIRFLEYRGADAVVAGDTTVAYTGPRGHRQNPGKNAGPYLDLARQHGWCTDGPAHVPFVVLDRPVTAISGTYEFTKDQMCAEIGGVQRFRDFFPAGGFAAADFMINHAHLTLHGLAGLAGCIKSIAMGCSGLNGKLRMHKSLLPFFDMSLCRHCGLCIENCPEDALADAGNDHEISVDSEKCIGCGECVSICKNKAIHLKGNEISNWTLGEETLPVRMADYTIGLMNGCWDRTVHVLHMYSITELCDCVNQKQRPFINDLGFLIGKNPFAVDRVAAGLLAREGERNTIAINPDKLKTAYATADYVQQHYGILSVVPFYPIYCQDLFETNA